MRASRRMAIYSVGVSAVPIGTLLPGDEIFLMENGVDTRFIVLQQGYEGSGVTLVVRKDAYNTTMKWTSRSTGYTNFNYIYECNVDPWMTGTYQPLLDLAVQTALVNVAIPTSQWQSSGGGRQVATTAQRSVFALSQKELGLNGEYYTVGEGTAIAWFNSNARRIAYVSGTARAYWTRSFSYVDKVYGWIHCSYIRTDGTEGAEHTESTANNLPLLYVRPALTLNQSFGVKLAA